MMEKATFAGGCFWCMQPPFDSLLGKGILKTEVGYMGGAKENPTYEDVCSSKSGHAEAIQITYDPSLISYSELLDLFWKSIDPTVKDRQFCDIGRQYRTAIFTHSEEQRLEAEKSKQGLKGRFDVIYTEIVPASTFWKAEDYHQKYYQKNKMRYELYHEASGREQTLKDLWEK